MGYYRKRARQSAWEKTTSRSNLCFLIRARYSGFAYFVCTPSCIHSSRQNSLSATLCWTIYPHSYAVHYWAPCSLFYCPFKRNAAWVLYRVVGKVNVAVALPW